jgi:acyl transferase domain-containing protein
MSSGDAVEQSGLEIAVIGMVGRFPGAPDVEAFWRNLRDGVESISFFSQEELAAGVSRALLSRPDYVRAKGVLAGAELFDADFFGFTPREAEVTDPQHRLFLEAAWEALETAGYEPATYRGLIGVYAGASLNSYFVRHLLPRRALMEAVGESQAVIASDKDYLATLVSYKLGLRGPSLAIQTACSTSLVAIHVACQALLGGECDMALAGGVSVRLPQAAGYLYQEGGIESPDGHCRAFDARAGGTVGGNGLGVVVLKRLQDALEDGDTVLAVVRGSAINNDGARKVGYTAPSVEGQASVIRAALEVAGVEPESIGYVEAHGTGTVLGDPIELSALAEAFGPGTPGRCAIGSVKTNIGHLDAASGVAGFIKATLALQRQALPPSLHFQAPNRHFDFARSPFFVNARLAEWKTGDAPRRAGVSSFGIGGTNAHAVLEEPPPVPASEAARPLQLLVLSARSQPALDAATRNLAAHLRAHPEQPLADVAYTLQVGRRGFDFRRVVVCEGREDAIRALEVLEPERVHAGRREATPSPVFMFPGQGAQAVHMGGGLYREEPVFREAVDACARLLRAHLGLDLRTLLFPEGGSQADAEGMLRRTAITQPALFTIEYALARLWMSWGVRPRAMIGHSVGEYVAACLAEVLSVEDALALVSARGALMQRMPPGGMLAVPLSEAQVLPLLGPALSLAAVNGPSATVIAGPVEPLEVLRQALAQRGVEGRPLQVSHAFHSAMMEPVLGAFLEEARRVKLHPPSMPYVSNVTGTWITPAEAMDPAYWVRHLREPVRFDAGLRTLLEKGQPLLMEVGPGHTLSRLARQQPGLAPGQPVLGSLPSTRKAPEEESRFLLGALGRAWLAGAEVDWKALHGAARRRVPLPTYPFERQRYWVEPAEAPEAAAPVDPPGQAGDSQRLQVPVWRQAPLGQATREAVAPGAWCVLGSGDGLGARLARRLTEAGGTVFEARPGPAFSRGAEREYTVDPRRAADMEALLAEVLRSGAPLRGVIHLWGLTRDEQLPDEVAPERGVESLLGLAQALARQGLPGPVRLMVVASHLHPVTDEERGIPAKAAMLEVCRVLSREAPGLSCQTVDVPWEASGSGREARRVEQLLAELTLTPAEPAVALRGTQRWRREWTPALTGPARPGARERGTWLLAGVPREAGSELARHLGAGAELSWLEGDSLDGEALARAVAEAAARGSLEGVLWLPRLVSEEPAASATRLDAAGLTDALSRASTAFQALARAAEAHGAAACFLLTPRAWLSGEGGTGRPAVAAAVLEALVHHRNQRGPTAWSVVGWEPRTAGPPREASGPAQGAKARHERPSLSTPFVPPSTEAEETIARIWRELLGLDAIGIHDDFFELGGHSLLGTQLASRLRSTFQINLPLRALLEAPTIAQQALVVEAALLDDLENESSPPNLSS